MRDAVKHCLPTYEVLNALGEGVHGVVYRVADGLKERAVKVVPLLVERSGAFRSSTDLDSKISQDFHAVREYYEKIEGPGVLKIHDFHLVDKVVTEHKAKAHLVILMEMCPDNLRDHVLDQAAPLAPVRALALMEELAGTLRRLADECGATYLVTDLKPSNLLFTASGALVIGDLGGLKRLGSVSSIAKAQFTPNWSAPETLMQGGAPTVPAAVYSYGLVSYFIWEGALPYEKLDFLQRISALKENGVTFARKDVPASIQSLIRSCLAQNPAWRPAGFGEILAAIARAPEDPEFQAATDALAVSPVLEKEEEGTVFTGIVLDYAASGAGEKEPDKAQAEEDEESGADGEDAGEKGLSEFLASLEQGRAVESPSVDRSPPADEAEASGPLGEEGSGERGGPVFGLVLPDVSSGGGEESGPRAVADEREEEAAEGPAASESAVLEREGTGAEEEEEEGQEAGEGQEGEEPDAEEAGWDGADSVPEEEETHPLPVPDQSAGVSLAAVADPVTALAESAGEGVRREKSLLPRADAGGRSAEALPESLEEDLDEVLGEQRGPGPGAMIPPGEDSCGALFYPSGDAEEALEPAKAPRVRCPGCGKANRVPPRAMKKRARCRSCGARLFAPPALPFVRRVLAALCAFGWVAGALTDWLFPGPLFAGPATLPLGWALAGLWTGLALRALLPVFSVGRIAMTGAAWAACGFLAGGLGPFWPLAWCLGALMTGAVIRGEFHDFSPEEIALLSLGWTWGLVAGLAATQILWTGLAGDGRASDLGFALRTGLMETLGAGAGLVTLAWRVRTLRTRGMEREEHTA
jgi:DNA-directed RNA polymerase subunit RPC12/RpoP